jgi:hypothetical protein
VGVPDDLRGEYDPVEEGKAPDLLGEFLSKESLGRDMGEKRDRYGALGVREYWLFNPWGKFAAPRIQGWTLHGSDPAEPLPAEADGSVASRVIPVRFTVHDELLDILDAESGEALSPLRAQQLRIREEVRARQREAEARQALEQEVERLRRQLEERG